MIEVYQPNFNYNRSCDGNYQTAELANTNSNSVARLANGIKWTGCSWNCPDWLWKNSSCKFANCIPGMNRGIPWFSRYYMLCPLPYIHRHFIMAPKGGHIVISVSVRSSVRHRLFLLTGSSLCSLLLRNYSTDFSNDDTNQLREQCRCATCTSF